MHKLVTNPAYISHKIFSRDLAAIHSTKSKLKLNRTVYVGQAVLDLSKHLMYDFWYNNIKAKYGNKAPLLCTDTDSLIMQVETPDIYADMCADRDNYDLSDYPKDHQYHDDSHKKVIGKFIHCSKG